jgi:hypothetical protein
VTAAPVLATTTTAPPSTTTKRSTTLKAEPKPTTRPPDVVGSRYDPTDAPYQGAEDPGLAADRAPNSAEVQTQ